MSQSMTPSVSLKTNPLIGQWLRFESNGTVTVFTGKVELGQGILHALKLMAAHELDLPVSSIHIQKANTWSLAYQKVFKTQTCSPGNWTSTFNQHRLCKKIVGLEVSNFILIII